MFIDDFIQTAINNVLKNPILSILRDINFSSILKQSNFKKKEYKHKGNTINDVIEQNKDAKQ